MAQYDSPEFAPETPGRDTCHFTFQDGRRCRMARSSNCVAHSQHDRTGHDVLSQILGSSGSMTTTVAINRVLRNLFVALLRRRIYARDTYALIRICALLLRSVGDVRGEIKTSYGEDGWIQTLETAMCAADSDSPDEPPHYQDESKPLLTDGDQNFTPNQ
jgi:hypothetical protein